MDPAEQSGYRLARWAGPNVGLAILAVEAPNRVTQEVETLLWYRHEVRLLLVHPKPQSFHQLPHPGHRRRTVSRPAADHQVIGIVDDLCVKLSGIAELLPGQKETTEVQVGHGRSKTRMRPLLRRISIVSGWRNGKDLTG